MLRLKRLVPLLLAVTMLLTIALPALATKTPIWVYATEEVNVRSGPSSVRYPVVGELLEGDKVEFIRYVGNWSEVDYDGKTAYVFTKYLSPLKDRSKPFTVTKADEDIQVKLYLGKAEFKAGEAITCHADVSYVGANKQARIYAGGNAVYFTVQGGKYNTMAPRYNKYTLNTFTEGRTLRFPYDGAAASGNSTLTLPRGEYVITATYRFMPAGSTEITTVRAAAKVKVV